MCNVYTENPLKSTKFATRLFFLFEQIVSIFLADNQDMFGSIHYKIYIYICVEYIFVA